jgi:hypothetical protein
MPLTRNFHLLNFYGNELIQPLDSRENGDDNIARTKNLEKLNYYERREKEI